MIEKRRLTIALNDEVALELTRVREQLSKEHAPLTVSWSAVINTLLMVYHENDESPDDYDVINYNNANK